MSRGAAHEPKLVKTPQPKPCPRCYAPARKTPDGWACDRHGLLAPEKGLAERDNRTDRDATQPGPQRVVQSGVATEDAIPPDFRPVRSASPRTDPATAAWLAEWDRRRAERRARRWTRAKVVAAIQEKAAELGRAPVATELHNVELACSRFGWKWADAVEAAGFTRPTRGKRARREQVPA